MKIVPAILTDNTEDFKNKISQAEKFAGLSQVDVMDGNFVPSESIGIDVLSSIDTDMELEFHLMASDPLEYLEAAKKSKVKRVIFHYEVDKVKHSSIIEAIRGLNMEVGLAINPGTRIKEVEHLFKEIDLLLFMAVNPGYYGSPFIPEVLDKAALVSAKGRDFILALDGGVKEENVLDIKKAGVDIACIGSAIFKADDPSLAYRAIQIKAA